MAQNERQVGKMDKTPYRQADSVLPPRLREAALASMKQKGMDGVIFDLKDQQGMVRYQSGLELVESNRAQAERAYPLPEVIEEIRQAGLVPVGRIWTAR